MLKGHIVQSQGARRFSIWSGGGGCWMLLEERSRVSKQSQGTIRLESAQIRWFSCWPGGRLVHANGGRTQGLYSCNLGSKVYSDKSWKMTLGSQKTYPKMGRVTAQTRVNWLSQLTLSHWVDEGGVVVVDDDDEWEPIKLITAMWQRFWVLTKLCSELSLNRPSMPTKEKGGGCSSHHTPVIW